MTTEAPNQATAESYPCPRLSAFHALACDRCKEDACAPGAHLVLKPAIRHLATDPEPEVRMMAAELVGKSAHTTPEAADALTTAHTNDSSPAVRKVAGWYAPGGTIYRKTALNSHQQSRPERSSTASTTNRQTLLRLTCQATRGFSAMGRWR